jgi:hypothetical protein
MLPYIALKFCCYFWNLLYNVIIINVTDMSNPLYIHVIACQVFMRELSYYASQCDNVVTFTWLPQGLHDTPALLQKSVAQALEQLHSQSTNNMRKHPPEAIVLGYGLCSNGIIGLSGGNLPLIVPKTDDCIAMLLGSQKRYLELFKKHNGTYWLSSGWVENAFIPSEKMLKDQYDGYVEKFGQENADYLYNEALAWIKNYNCCAYISSPVCRNRAHEQTARDIAASHNWQFNYFDGDTRMIQKIVNGDWDDEFLTCPPRHKIGACYDENKIKAVENVQG